MASKSAVAQDHRKFTLRNHIAINSNAVQVDERLNGDGAGIALGINEPILGFVMLGVFGSVWILYSLSAKSLGGQEEEDGLSL